MSDTLYIKLEQSKELSKSIVTVSDIARMQCKNKHVINKVGSHKLIEDHTHGKERYVVSIMEIIEVIEQVCESVDVVNIGETECVIEFKHRIMENKALDIIKIIAISVILFFGAGFSIMAFNNDVGIHQMFEQITMQLSVNQAMGINILAVSYSIGIAIGIIVFYNHFGNKKLSKDPTPIEVEMRKYEKEINLTLIAQSGRTKKDSKQ